MIQWARRFTPVEADTASGMLKIEDEDGRVVGRQLA